MTLLARLLEGNKRWAQQITQQDPGFFERLAGQQSPRCLWIGCSDSRVPANQIVDVLPGQIFVHRNVANVVIHTDLNCLSVIQYAVEVLRIEDIVVCGHYGCGGVQAALSGQNLGLISNWLRHVQEVQSKHGDLLESLPHGQARADKLCELNVIEQVVHVCETTIVQAAWGRGQAVAVHGWIYRLCDGVIHDLGMSVNGAAELGKRYAQVLQGRQAVPVPA